MGDERFYMCEPNVLTVELIEKHAPDHGLLFVKGNIVRVAKEAPRREFVNKDGEIRFLRFAIINAKQPHEEEVLARASETPAPPKGGEVTRAESERGGT